MIRRYALGIGIALAAVVAVGVRFALSLSLTLLATLMTLFLGSLAGAIWLRFFRKRWEPLGTVGRAVAPALAGLLTGMVLFAMMIAGVTWIRHRSILGDLVKIPPIPRDVGVYLALGDSYSAGEGVRPYEDGSDDAARGGDDCHRSKKAYPRLLTFVPEPSETRFRACSGARAGQLTKFVQPTSGGGNRYGVQANDEAFKGNVGLITLTVGGNDLHFSDILRHCFTVADCLTQIFDPGPASADETEMPVAAPMGEWANAMFPILGARLDSVFKDLRQRTKTARIIVLGYPNLFPSGEATSAFDDCSIVLRRVDQREREGIRELTTRFNDLIYNAAAANGVEFVATDQVWGLHEPCGVFGQYTNAALPGRRGLDRGAFHPTATGQRVLARTVACYLREYPLPFDPFERINLPGSPSRTFGPFVTPERGPDSITIRRKPAPGTFLNRLSCERK